MEVEKKSSQPIFEEEYKEIEELKKESEEKWNAYWVPESEEDAITKLIEKIQLGAIFNAELDQGVEKEEASWHIKKSIVPEYPFEYPDHTVEYKKADGSTRKYMAKGSKISVDLGDIKTGISVDLGDIRTGIETQFKEYYPSRARGIGSLFGFMGLAGIVLFFYWIFFLAGRHLGLFFDGGMYGAGEDPENLANIYLFTYLIYYMIACGIPIYTLEKKIRPSKVYWFYILPVIAVPLLFFYFDLQSGFTISQTILQLPSLGPAEMENLSRMHQIYLVSLFLTCASILSGMMESSSPKGQLLYTLASFEMAAKIGGAKNIRKMNYLLNILLTALNDMLIEYFSLELANRKLIIESFNKNLFEGGTEFLKTIKILDDPDVIRFFATGIRFKPDQDLSSKEIIKKWFKEIKTRRQAKRKSSNEEYRSIINDLHLISEKIEIFSKPTQTKFKRITVKDRIMGKYKQIISIGLSGLVSFAIPLYQFLAETVM